MNIRKINRAVHRDLGYFFFGMCIIYGLSGIALNHRHHWNPNYIVKQQEFNIRTNNVDPQSITRDFAEKVLDELDEPFTYRTHIVSGHNMRIFVEGGTVNLNLMNGAGNFETIRKRPVFHEVNFLHYNTPRKLWTWFSDMYAAGLIILAITGLFVLKGKNGITRRGAYITSAGVIIPIVLLYLYLNS
jgi:uncharacterized protein